MRLDEQDQLRVRQLQERIRSFAIGDPAVLCWLPEAVRTLCGAEGALGYRVDLLGGRISVTAQFAGASRCAGEQFRAWIERANCQWDAFDPLLPEALQRNRVVGTESPSTMLATGRFPRGANGNKARRALTMSTAELFQPLGWDAPQVRLLSCEGAHLLGYLGLVNRDGFEQRAHAILAALAPALKSRLLLERQVAGAGLARSALEAILELMPAAAFVIADRRIEYANRVGTRWLARAEHRVRERLLAAPGPDADAFSVTPLDAGRAVLAMLRAEGDAEPSYRIGVAARRFGLTPRETEVMSWLAQGVTNHRIAAELACAEATIEVHVSRILAKAAVPSRTALLATCL